VMWVSVAGMVLIAFAAGVRVPRLTQAARVARERRTPGLTPY
jgi:hypothetical protein